MIQIQADRHSSLVQVIDLRKFTIRENRRFDEIQHRNSGFGKGQAKNIEIIFSCSFNYDVLITHFEIELIHFEIFKNIFQFCDAEASSISNRGQYLPMIHPKMNEKKQENKKIIIDAIAFSQSVKLSILLKKQFTNLYADLIPFKKQKNKNSLEENISKMIGFSIKDIKICGFIPNIGPYASQLTTLLNISQAFRKANRLEDAAQTDILVSLSLINARRFVQASELLRKVSKFFIQKYTTSKSSMEFARIQKSWIRETEVREQLDYSNINKSFTTGRVLEGGKFLYKAAKIQLLLAETINHPSLISQKLEAYNNANSYSLGNIAPEKIPPHSDLEEVAYTIGSSIMPFLIKVLSDKTEILKIGALKSIQFFYETLGCTLASVMPQILKAVLLNYPNNKKNQVNVTQLPLNIDIVSQQKVASSKNKILFDHYHHLLETLLSIVPNMNKKYLRVILTDIIMVNISVQNLRNEVRLYLLRFSEKIISICGPDLDIPVQFLICIINLCEGKMIANDDTSNNKHLYHNLVYFAQKVLQILKSKILLKSDKASILPICNWLNQTLIYLCQNEVLSSSSFVLNQILDFLNAIYHKKLKIKVTCPIQPIIYLLNMSFQQQRLPFEKILDALIILIKFVGFYNFNSQIPLEIIERIMKKSKNSTLNMKELRVLEKVLECTTEIDEEWLFEFLDCIPHSNFDQTYAVFDILIKKSTPFLHKPMINKIINIFLDQYTVKGKAHQHSKETFIQILLHSDTPQNMLKIFDVCLFLNSEPKSLDYFARKKRQKEHIFDSKMFKIDYELFSQKLNLLSLVLTKIEELNTHSLEIIFTQSLVCKFIKSLKNLLESTNFKLKSRTLILIKHLVIVFSNKNKEKSQIDFQFGSALLDLLKRFLIQQKDSNIHYYSILNVGLIFDRIFIINLSSDKDNDQNSSKAQLIEKDTEEKLEVAEILPKNMINRRINEFLKIWPSLTNLLNSPWENVRSMLILVLQNFCSLGISIYKPKNQDKIISLLKPLLLTLMQSHDHDERAAGLKILACLYGFAKQLNKEKIALQIRASAKSMRIFHELIFMTTDDWDQNVAAISQLLFSLCASFECQEIIRKKNNSERRFQQNLGENSFFSNFEEEVNYDKKSATFMGHNFDNLESILKQTERSDEDEVCVQAEHFAEIDEKAEIEIEKVRKLIEICKHLQMQKFEEKESFAEQEEQHYFEPNQEKESEGRTSQEQQLEFQDLGIIQLDDEEWGEEENQMKITQKLPLKKIYKLSPNLGSSSKHHRIRSKRYHQTQFEHHDKIIIDELEAKINPILSKATEPNHLSKLSNQWVESEKEEKIEKPEIQMHDQEEAEQFQDFQEEKEKNEVVQVQVPSKKEITKKASKGGTKKRKSTTTK